VFIVDATVTLSRRLLRHERVHLAHRSHAYQYASRLLGGHRPVTIATAVINVCWLTPVAAAVVFARLGMVAGVVIAYAPLVALAFWYRAGAEEQQAN
jgi:Fuc2NAc and GlcNAc transferase